MHRDHVDHEDVAAPGRDHPDVPEPSEHAVEVRVPRRLAVLLRRVRAQRCKGVRLSLVHPLFYTKFD